MGEVYKCNRKSKFDSGVEEGDCGGERLEFTRSGSVVAGYFRRGLFHCITFSAHKLRKLMHDPSAIDTSKWGINNTYESNACSVGNRTKRSRMATTAGTQSLRHEWAQ